MNPLAVIVAVIGCAEWACTSTVITWTPDFTEAPPVQSDRTLHKQLSLPDRDDVAAARHVFPRSHCARLLDDRGSLTAVRPGHHGLLEVLDGRYAPRGNILALERPIEHRHDVVGEPTLGDAILDRVNRWMASL
ncbi:MAG: ATP-binding protein [Gammaproteobacteria bacterium]|nr:ATP-binding protein [Gammaproteobacteria bacterium]